jgi:DNA-binding transcriptional LysR family regulator
MDKQEPPEDVLPHADLGVPNWDDFRLLMAVLRSGSLTKAGRALGLSQATVSRQMDKLERGVGIRLLERSTSGAELTPDGIRLLEELREVWEKFGRAIDRMKSSSRERAIAKMVTTDGVATYWIPRFLSWLNDDVELRLFTALEAGQDKFENFDLSIHYMQPNNPNAMVTKLGMFHFMPFASPDYLARRGMPRSPKDLANHDLLDHAIYLIDKGTWQTRLPSDAGEARISLYTNSSTVLGECVRNGLGICWLPTYVPMVDSKFVPIDVGLHLSTPVFLCYHRDSEAKPGVRAVIHFLKHIFDRKRMPWLRDEFVLPSEFPPMTTQDIMASFKPLKIS